jgi:hypothetical protein
MIELINDTLHYSFPKVHPEATLTIQFQRTLRIPDDGKDYPLPPGLGRFPLRHVDDFAKRVPEIWIERAGVILPMYQSEALWMSFDANYIENRETNYPFAIKIGTGKINAITGSLWFDGLQKNPQSYLVAPEQPWLDGYCVDEGFIRQFVAMPLGAGYSAEEQLTGKAEYGGIQIAVYPMKRGLFEQRFPIKKYMFSEDFLIDEYRDSESVDACMGMGLAPGGRMRQEIYEDPFDFTDWDLENQGRCFVNLANSMVWRSITGENPPTVPLTSKEYAEAGLPWFDYYDDNAKALEGSANFKKLKSIKEMAKTKGDQPLPENESVTPERIIKLRRNLKPDQVREAEF